MAAAGPDAVLLPLPARVPRREVAAEVIDGPRSRVIEQGHNRMHAARGLLAFLMGVRLMTTKVQRQQAIATADRPARR